MELGKSRTSRWMCGLVLYCAVLFTDVMFGFIRYYVSFANSVEEMMLVCTEQEVQRFVVCFRCHFF